MSHNSIANIAGMAAIATAPGSDLGKMPAHMPTVSTERQTLPLKVVMAGSYPPLKGISSYCQSLASAVSRRTPVEFLSFNSMYPSFLYPGGGQFDASLPSSAPAHGLKVRRCLNWYGALGWVRTGMRMEADVFHTQYWSMPLAPIFLTLLSGARRRGIPTVLTLHNVQPHEPSRAFGPVTRMLCRLADRCIVHSEENREEAITRLGLPAEKLRVVPHGVLDMFNEAPCDRAEARRGLGLPLDAPVILFFGAIRPYKGLDVLLRAFALLRRRLPRAQLLVAGQSWDDWRRYGDLMEQLGVTGSVRLALDYIPADRVKAYFAAADLAVLPYRHFAAQSGAGLVAIGFGAPLIVARVGALPELVADGRFVVPPGEAQPLAESMALALTDPALLEQMRADARRTARAFSWEAIADRTLAVYEEVCVERKRSRDARR